MHEIVISEDINKLSQEVCKHVKKEWYAFPIGYYKCHETGECYFYVTDLYIPKQLASITHVTIPASDISISYEVLKDYLNKNKNLTLLGMWHSHGDIGVFHSSEDLANIERIYQTFTGMLPYSFVGGTPISIALSQQFSVEPIINEGFRGIKMTFGTSTFEIDFGTGIKDKDFFVKWYTYFHDIKLFLELLNIKYVSNPMLKTIIKNKIYYIMSVVVNNRTEFDGRVFQFEISSSGVKKSSEKAKIRNEKLKEKPVISPINKLNEILNKIK